MDKKLKSSVSFVLALSMAWNFSSNILAETNYDSTTTVDNSWKISEDLQKLIDKSSEADAIPTMIWFNDISQEELQEQASEAALTKVSSVYSKNPYDKDLLISSVNMDEFDNVSSTIENSEEYRMYVDELIVAERALAMSEYETHNTDFIINYIPDKEIIFQSEFAPMVIAYLNPGDINRLKSLPFVNDLAEYDESEICIDENDSNETMPDTRAFELLDSVKGNATYFGTGAGIKIGLIENDQPDKTNSELSKSTIEIITGSNVGSHATKMARFIVGSAGLAPDAALYCVEASNFYKNIETLIENGVNIINMSCGFTSNQGKYSVRAKWIDHLAAYHKVAFVKSAGNDGKTHKITDPGMAYNAITIGNIDEISPPTLDVNSCKEEDNGIADKPDFTNIGSGTSQAAAITTGIVALMMEKMPSLKKSTRMIKALLAAGTTKDTDHNVMGNNSTSIMTDECGAGFINAYNACRSGYFTKTINSDEVEYNTTTAVRVGQYFRASIAWHAYSTSKCDGTSGTGSMNIYELNVYQGNVLLATLKNPSNHKIIF